MAKQEIPVIFKKWYFWVIVVAFAIIIGLAMRQDEKTVSNKKVPQVEDTDVNNGDESSVVSLIERTIRERAKGQYEATAIDNILIYDETDNGIEDYTIIVYLTFNRKNTPSKAQPVVDMYADDLAAWVGKEHNNVTKVYIYWTLPNIVGDKVNTSNPYMIYDRASNGMAITDKNWPFQ